MATRKPKMAREIAREKDMLNQGKQIKQLTAENEDLRARCKELEEMLREKESKLETENMHYKRQIEISGVLEKQRDYAEYKCDRLIEERHHLLKELEQVRKPWWKKVFSRG